MKSRWNKKRKVWLNKHSKQRTKHKCSGRGAGESFAQASSSIFVPLTPPTNFSLINNTEETIRFFEEFSREIRAKQYGKEFYIDSSKVEQVTVDALIYLNQTAQAQSFSSNSPL